MSDWTTEAVCAQVGGDIWFPKKGANGTLVAQAKAICAECPVRAQCLDHALETGSWDGIFGGLSGKERRKVARDRLREAA